MISKTVHRPPPPAAPKLGGSGDTAAAAPGAGRAGLVEAPREGAGSDPTLRPTTGRPRPSTPTSRRAGSRKPKAALPEHGPRGTAVDGPADRAAGRPFQGDGDHGVLGRPGGPSAHVADRGVTRWSRPVPPWVQSILGTLVDGREFSPLTSGRGMGPTSPPRTRVSTSASDDAAARPRHRPSKSCDPASTGGGAARESTTHPSGATNRRPLPRLVEASALRRLAHHPAAKAGPMRPLPSEPRARRLAAPRPRRPGPMAVWGADGHERRRPLPR